MNFNQYANTFAEFHFVLPWIIKKKYDLKNIRLNSYRVDFSHSYEQKIFGYPSMGAGNLNEYLISNKDITGYQNEKKIFDEKLTDFYFRSNILDGYFDNEELLEKTELPIGELIKPLLKSLSKSTFHPHEFRIPENLECEEMLPLEIVQNFSSYMKKWFSQKENDWKNLRNDLNDYLRFEEYYNSKKYYLVKNITNAYFDIGVVITNERLNFLIYFEYINDQ